MKFFVLLYIGPEAFLPITSALAAIAGAILIFWNRVVAVSRKILGWLPLTRRPGRPRSTSRPE